MEAHLRGKHARHLALGLAIDAIWRDECARPDPDGTNLPAIKNGAISAVFYIHRRSGARIIIGKLLAQGLVRSLLLMRGGSRRADR